MGITIILCAVEVFSTVLQKIFCDRILTKRNNNKPKEYMVWLIYFFIFNIGTYFINSSTLVNMTVFICSFFLSIKFIYNNPNRTLIIVTFFLYLSGMCSELLVYFGNKIISLNLEKERTILLVVLSKIIWFCLIKFVSLIVKLNRKEELNKQDWLEVFTVPMGSVVILLALFNGSRPNEGSLEFVAVLMIMVINIFTYYLYDKAKENIEKRMREQLLVQQCQYYIRQHSESREWWQELEQYRHDMKQRYILEKAFLENKKYEELNKFLNESIAFIEGKNIVSNTGNFYVDSIINYKADIAQRYGINFVLNLHIPNDLRFNLEDLNICLGNLIDNAIEASKDVCDKSISINLKVDGSNLFLYIVNSFSDPRKKENGVFITSKKEKGVHGLGLKIVRKIVEKYDGEMDISEEGNRFKVTVLLYNFAY